MKYILTLILAMAFFNMDAQNLQFSQVLTLSGQVNVSNQAYLIGTVPEGKVWKIESLNNLGSGFWYQINGAEITTGNYNYPTHFPIWLKAQDNISFYNNSVGSQPRYFVSIIEFTIVP